MKLDFDEIFPVIVVAGIWLFSLLLTGGGILLLVWLSAKIVKAVLAN